MQQDALRRLLSHCTVDAEGHAVVRVTWIEASISQRDLVIDRLVQMAATGRGVAPEVIRLEVGLRPDP